MEDSCMMMGHGEPYAHNVRQTPDQIRPFCPANRERDLLNQDLEMFWAHHNSRGLHDKLDLPLARIKKVMKSNPQVTMVSSDSPVLLAKACEIFIQEVTLRAWRQTQSCSRNTIRSTDIHKALRSSVIYDELADLVSLKQCYVNHQGVPQGAVHQPNMNVPEMKAPIDIDQIQEQTLYNQTTDQFIEIGEFELDPKLQVDYNLIPWRETQLKDGEEI